MKHLGAAAIIWVGAHLSACNLCSNTDDCPSPLVCSADGQCVELAPNPARDCFDGSATITIRVTAPDGITPAGRSSVRIDGQDVETDAEGKVVVTLEKGQHTVNAARDGFFGQTTFEVCGGRDADISVGIKPPPGRIAVVPGSFDSIEDVLSSMGFALNVDYRILDAGEVAQPGAFADIDYLFFNCGHLVNLTDATVQDNIRVFVEGGGRLYTSDWAIDVVNTLWPDAVDGVGAEGPELEGAAAEILDNDLAQYLGKNNVSLNYNLGAWESLSGVGPGTVTMVRGTEGYVAGDPLLVQFLVGEGRVTYTTFHNEAQTTADMDRILAFLVFTL